MIAKLERTQSNAYQNNDQLRTLQTIESTLNNRSKTTEPPPRNGLTVPGVGVGVKCILLVPNLDVDED